MMHINILVRGKTPGTAVSTPAPAAMVRDGLAVTPGFEAWADQEGGRAIFAKRGVWNVTHVVSGYAVNGRPFDTQADARTFLRLIVPLADWYRSGEDLGKDKSLGLSVRAAREGALL